MKHLFKLLILAAAVLILTACQPAGSSSPTTIPPAATAESTIPASFTPVPDEWPAAAYSTRQVLAQVLGLSNDEVTILRVESARWPDGCLGLDLAGPCNQMVTDGFIVSLEVGGATYVYHTDETGGNVLLASAPPVDISEPVLSWTNEWGACLTLGMQAGAFGLCGAPQITTPLSAEIITRNLGYFHEQYGPFTATTPTGTVTFNGAGGEVASPAEQRMIAEWAELIWPIVQTGHAGASFGLALAFHREGGLAGICEDISVLLTGEYWINSCAGGNPVELSSGRLDPDQLSRLYQWIDTFVSFEWTDDSDIPVDGLAQEMVFSGRGRTSVDEQGRGELNRQLMLDLVGELSGDPPATGDVGTGEPSLPDLILSGSPCETGSVPGVWCLLGPDGVQGLNPPTPDAQLLSFDPETRKVLYATHFPSHGSGPGNMAVGDLWVWDITSGETQPIIPEETVIRASWAPDGSIAYLRATGTTNELRLQTPSGEDRLLAEDVPHLFSVSPDGSQIAFTRETQYNLDRHPPGLYAVPLETGVSSEDGEERLVAAADRAGQGSSEDAISWSPDGSSLIMPVGQEWLLAAADGRASGMLSFAETLAGEPWFGYTPNRILWFPDGDRLVAAVETGGPGLPEPVQWWTLILDLDPSSYRWDLVEAIENTGILLGWDVPGESVWITPTDGASLPERLTLEGTE